LTFFEAGRVWAGVLGASPDRVVAVERTETGAPRPTDMFLDTTQLRDLGIGVPTLAVDAERHHAWYFGAVVAGGRP
jgi:hypothetical protein